jgi:hypothetical protein
MLPATSQPSAVSARMSSVLIKIMAGSNRTPSSGHVDDRTRADCHGRPPSRHGRPCAQISLALPFRSHQRAVHQRLRNRSHDWQPDRDPFRSTRPGHCTPSRMAGCSCSTHRSRSRPMGTLPRETSASPALGSLHRTGAKIADVAAQSAAIRSRINSSVGDILSTKIRGDRKLILRRRVLTSKDAFLSLLDAVQQAKIDPYDLDEDPPD